MVHPTDPIQSETPTSSAGVGIDPQRLQELLQQQGKDMPKVSGRVINVVNQIPFECILDREDQQDVSIAEHMRAAATYRRQREGSLSNGSGNSVEAPISHLAKRRSTMPTLGETDMWRLNARRGHSAMYSGLDSLKQNYDTLYIGSTGNIVSNHSDHVACEDLRQEERNSLGSLLFLKHQMIPIFIDDKLAHGHYEGYCKQGPFILFFIFYP